MSGGIFIVAAERSGDDLGAGLITELLRQGGSDIKVFGIGGAAMAALGVSSDIDISPLSVWGLTEAIMAMPMVQEKVRDSVALIMKTGPDAVVLIDSWGFTIRVAFALKKAGFAGKIIKYVAPQVFATRPGRAVTLAKAADHLLTIHNFDAPFFERQGLPVTFVGNPVYDMDYKSGNGQALRKRLNIPKEAPVVAVFFGSRLSEIQRLAAPFADTVALVREKRPNVHFISPVSVNIAEDVLAVAGADLRLQDVILLPEADKLDIFDAADAALACSGTVTTQLACAGVPTVVAYRLSGLTYIISKYMIQTKYISMVNIAADKAILPEFIQRRATGRLLSDAVLKFVTDESYAEATSNALTVQTTMMRGTGGIASARAAKAVLEMTV